MTVFSWLDTVHHDGSPLYVQPQAAGLGAQVTLRLRVSQAAPIRQVFIRICPDGEQTMVPMQPAEQQAAVQWWQGQITLSMPRTGYRFWLLTDDGGWWFSQAGIAQATPTDTSDFRMLANFAAPDWVRSSVFYQIFPDRFADGDPANNVQSGEYLCNGQPVIARPWGAPPRSHQESGGVEFFGGDLPGITQHLDYLSDLGVNALYLNPIFSAPSNHKYDTADYRTVDPHFGGDAALVELRAATAARDMRLMLDIVLNHCGVAHHWFTAAQADRSAPSADFFVWHDHPDDYESWLGHTSLPKLNYASAHLRQEIYAGEDAIIRHWLRPPYSIDGWRLDVANMLARQGATQLGHKIGRALRRAVKHENPDAYLLGEHFYDGTAHLGGDELDASMNYRGFTFPLLQWLAGFDMASVWNLPWADTARLPTAALVEQWRAFLAAIPWQIALQQFNLLNSHDTPRLRTIVNDDLDLLRVAVTLQMTFPGVPSIYYGDEVGMAGGGDPFCRACMDWNSATWDHELRDWYKAIIALRRSSPALSSGGLQLLYGAEHTLAFMRAHPAESLLVIASRAHGPPPLIPLHAAGLPDGTQLRRVGSNIVLTVANGHLHPPANGPLASIWRVIEGDSNE